MSLFKMMVKWLIVVISFTLAFSESSKSCDSEECFEGEIAEEKSQFVGQNKRTQTVTSDLDTLADMIYSQERRRRLNHMEGLRSHLLKIGKRSWRNPILNRPYKVIQIPKIPVVTQRRADQLSISGPLSNLANMLASENRRRMHAESSLNRQRLLELGKRGEFNDTER
ncbi:hypothetical protein CHS0354_026885 [Potamilus streckersoni]|uniref:Corticotropin-releasing factor domain-containing protein n=1 Tax=Potamilus streckersoni TaxID=2493646 RepID=A0AAE0SPP9_9BIVA|nr:hypothetical protein CHS0354_026885 [Potamilus streckersoni]